MIRIIETLTKTNPQANRLGDIIVSIPRIVCGLILSFDFGSSKFGVPWSSNDLPFLGIPQWFVEDVATFGGIFALAPYFFAWMAAASETIGGLLLAIGLKTRLASFLLICTMIVAIFFQKWDQGTWGLLPAAGFLWVSMYSLVMGSGRFGLDYLVSKAIARKKMIHIPIDQMKIKTTIQKSLFILIISVGASTGAFAQERIVTLSVDMNQVSNPAKVGVRGSISPLSWEKDYPLSDDDGDGVYTSEIRFNTSKRYFKFKFVNNDQLELEGADQRILWFEKKPQSKSYTFNEFEYYSREQIESLIYSEDQIKEDIAVLKEIVQYIHPAVYKFRDSATLQSDFAALEKEILSKPDLVNSYKSISKFLAKIKCSHTFTNPWNQGPDIEKAIFYQPDKLPFTFTRINKRLFIDKNASTSNQFKKGYEIVSINGISTNTILTSLAQYVTSDGNNYEKKLERLSLTGSEKFSMFDIFYPLEFGNQSTFEVVLKDLETKEVFNETVQAVSKTNRTKILKERYSKLETSLRDGWNFKILENDVGILTIKSFSVFRNEFDWKKLIDEAFEELNKKSIPNLVIDIRENEGGQGEVGEYILEYVIQKPFEAPAVQSSVRYLTIPEKFKRNIDTWAKFPYDFSRKTERKEGDKYILKQKYSVAGKTYQPKKNGYKGEVYLLTGASNSSATHLMAAYAKQIDGITLVGQETGGNQLGTNGSFIFFLRLPNTRVEVDIPVVNMFVPSVSGQVRDGGIIPDIYVEKNDLDLVKNVDTELEAVLQLINKK